MIKIKTSFKESSISDWSREDADLSKLWTNWSLQEERQKIMYVNTILQSLFQINSSKIFINIYKN